MREITRLEGVVAQQRQWNREKNIKTAESKLKVIERLERDLEKPQAAPESIRFQFEIKQPEAMTCWRWRSSLFLRQGPSV